MAPRFDLFAALGAFATMAILVVGISALDEDAAIPSPGQYELPAMVTTTGPTPEPPEKPAGASEHIRSSDDTGAASETSHR